MEKENIDLELLPTFTEVTKHIADQVNELLKEPSQATGR